MKRPKFSHKINEDSESEQNYEASVSASRANENDELGVARVTADFQGFDQARKSPVTQANFMSRPMGVEKNPINQTGQLVSFRKKSNPQRRHPEKDFIVYQLQMQAEYENALHNASKSRSKSKKKKQDHSATIDSTHQVSPKMAHLQNTRSISDNKKRNIKKQFNSIGGGSAIKSKKNKLNEYTQLPVLKNMVMVNNPSMETEDMDLTFADDQSKGKTEHKKTIQGRN